MWLQAFPHTFSVGECWAFGGRAILETLSKVIGDTGTDGMVRVER